VKFQHEQGREILPQTIVDAPVQRVIVGDGMGVVVGVSNSAGVSEAIIGVIADSALPHPLRMSMARKKINSFFINGSSSYNFTSNGRYNQLQRNWGSLSP
jgi:hypothetical protein